MADTSKDNSGTVIVLGITTGVAAIAAGFFGISYFRDEKFITDLKKAGAIDGTKVPTDWKKKFDSYKAN